MGFLPSGPEVSVWQGDVDSRVRGNDGVSQRELGSRCRDPLAVNDDRRGAGA